MSLLEFSLSKQLFTAHGKKQFAVSASFEDGAFIAVVGESGAGKTTLLRMLCGLTKPDSGTIRCGGDVWYDHARHVNVPPQKRGAGMVFQDYALFPHMTVRGNLQYASRGDTSAIDEILEITGLTQLAGRYPATLSGGQRQRVALARAVINRPRLLLLDEPLSALDEETRAKLRTDIQLLQRQFGVTTIMVTHDTAEVFQMCSRVLRLHQGQLVEEGTPHQLYLPTMSAKVNVVGTVVQIEVLGVAGIAYVAIGQSVARILISPEEAGDFAVGDRVGVVTKAFSPILIKMHTKKQ